MQNSLISAVEVYPQPLTDARKYTSLFVPAGSFLPPVLESVRQAVSPAVATAESVTEQVDTIASAWQATLAMTMSPAERLFEDQRRLAEALRALHPLNESFREFLPPRTPRLRRRTNGRPDYIEYARELSEFPRTGVWGALGLELQFRYGPRSIYGDLWLLSDDRISGEARLAAAQRFVQRHIKLRLANPQANNELRRLIGRRDYSQQQLLESALPAIVMLAADECTKFHRVRLGKSWVKNRSGRSKLVRPIILNPQEYYSWLRQRVYRHFTQMVQREFLPEAVPVHYELDWLDEPAGMDLISATEPGLIKAPTLFSDEALSTLPRTQRKYVRTLLTALGESDSLTEARKRTARSMKISPDYERQLHKRISDAISKQTPRKANPIGLIQIT